MSARKKIAGKRRTRAQYAEKEERKAATLRMPTWLWDALAEAAIENNRTVTAEIVHRLKTSIRQEERQTAGVHVQKRLRARGR